MTLTEKEYISRIWWLWFKTHISVAHSLATNGFICLNLFLFAFTYLEGAKQLPWMYLGFIFIVEGWILTTAIKNANWQIKEVKLSCAKRQNSGGTEA